MICPSRPGYLRTPLSTAMTFDKQADLMIALLDAITKNKKLKIIRTKAKAKGKKVTAKKTYRKR